MLVSVQELPRCLPERGRMTTSQSRTSIWLASTSDTLGVAGRWLALPAAIGASLLALPLGVILVPTMPAWRSEFITSFVAAFAWMSAGLAFSGVSRVSGTLLFLAGAACAWFLSAGIVHSVSPLYGVFTFAAACVGGALAWWLRARRTNARLALSLPAIALLVVLARAVATSTLGVTRELTVRGERPVRVSVTSEQEASGFHVQVWRQHDDIARAALPADVVEIELDPGSGPGRYRLVRITDTIRIGAVCSRLRDDTHRLVRQEIARGDLPEVAVAFRRRVAPCERGVLWEAIPDDGAGAATDRLR